MKIADLEIGQVVSYMYGGYETGKTEEMVILESYSGAWGDFTKVLYKETNHISEIQSKIELSDIPAVGKYSLVNPSLS